MAGGIEAPAISVKVVDTNDVKNNCYQHAITTTNAAKTIIARLDLTTSTKIPRGVVSNIPAILAIMLTINI